MQKKKKKRYNSQRGRLQDSSANSEPCHSQFCPKTRLVDQDIYRNEYYLSLIRSEEFSAREGRKIVAKSEVQ